MASSPGAWRAGNRQPGGTAAGRWEGEPRPRAAATARMGMDGACGGSCSALPGNRRPRAGIGVGGGRCTVLPPRSLITARRGRGRIGWMPKVVGVSSLPWTIGIATVTNKRTAGPHCMCWVSVRPGASVLPVSLWRSVERLRQRQRQSTERKTDRQAGGSCVQAASSHAAQVQYSRRSRRTVSSSSRRQGSSCAAPPLHVAHGMYSAICWACGAGETGTSNWDPPFRVYAGAHSQAGLHRMWWSGTLVSPGACRNPCWKTHGSRSMAAGIGTCHYCTCTWCSEHEHCSRPLALLVTPVVDTRQAGSPRAKGVRR